MKVILHIGANKAGSTALQRSFQDNRATLLQRGILWPKTGLHAGAHYDLSTWLGFSQGGSPLDEHGLEVKRRALQDEFERSGANVAILSSEYFMLRRPLDRLRAFFDGMDLQVVAVLRRHDSWWPSLWAQALKTVENPPWQRSFESYHDFQSKRGGQFFDFRALIETWDNIAPGRVIAIPFEESRLPDGITPAFLAAVGHETLASELPGSNIRVNESSRIDVLSLVDFLHRAKGIPPEHKRKLISKALAGKGSGPKVGEFISGHRRRALALERADEYAFLDRRFGGDTQEPFFRAPLPTDDGGKDPHWLPAIPAIELLVNDILA